VPEATASDILYDRGLSRTWDVVVVSKSFDVWPASLRCGAEGEAGSLGDRGAVGAVAGETRIMLGRSTWLRVLLRKGITNIPPELVLPNDDVRGTTESEGVVDRRFDTDMAPVW
jgi:hypothetical protein